MHVVADQKYQKNNDFSSFQLSTSRPVQYSATLKDRIVMVQNICCLESGGKDTSAVSTGFRIQKHILNILPRICAWMSAYACVSCVCVVSCVCLFVTCVCACVCFLCVRVGMCCVCASVSLVCI